MGEGKGGGKKCIFLTFIEYSKGGGRERGRARNVFFKTFIEYSKGQGTLRRQNKLLSFLFLIKSAVEKTTLLFWGLFGI